MCVETCVKISYISDKKLKSYSLYNLSTLTLTPVLPLMSISSLISSHDLLLREPATLSTTQFSQIFDFIFFIQKMKQYVCRNLCENFIQIGQKIKKLQLIQFEYFDVTACIQILARWYTHEGG